jgi:AcrR family transcriptional regulator
MTPRSIEENERIREQQRERILEAAARLFARRGLAGTRIADVAAEAGVSHGLVHHYFSTKNDLFAALVEKVLSNATAVPEQALEMPPAEGLRHLVDTMLLGVRYAPELYMIVVQAESSDAVPEEVRARVARLGEEGNGAVARVIERAQTVGEAREGDALVLAQHLGAFVQGLAVSRMFAGEDAAGFPDAGIVLGMLKG